MNASKPSNGNQSALALVQFSTNHSTVHMLTWFTYLSSFLHSYPPESNMFQSPLLEVTESKKFFNYDRQHDSFSSSSASEGEEFLTIPGKRVSKKRSKRKVRPTRSISGIRGSSVEEKAKQGIFVIDPFHCRVNVEFLRAFAKHHHTQPYLRSSDTPYFTSSGDEDDLPASEYILPAPDLSHMGFTTGSSDEEHVTAVNINTDWDGNEVKPSTKPSRSAPKRKPPSSTSSSSRPVSVNSAKIVTSSSLPRPADNSVQFPELLTDAQVEKLFSRVNSNYKSFPQNHRHGSTPMDIRNAPGVKLLTEDEFIACCLLRIRPALYFHARNTLLHNFHHSVGYFRKSAAQKMLRIDVNKTGKLYDFLVRQNWIPEAEGGSCQPEPKQVIIDDPEVYHQL